MTISPGS